MDTQKTTVDGADAAASLRLGRTLAAGVVAGAIGAVAWAVVSASSGYEIGWLAVGIGGLTGYAVSRAGGRPLGVRRGIAIGCALAGLLVGKYLSFVLVARDAGFDVAFLSGETWHAFLLERGEVFSAYDALWALFAVSTAVGFAGTAEDTR